MVNNRVIEFSCIGKILQGNITNLFLLFLNDILEWNNDYSDTLDFRKEWVGEMGVVTFFVLEVPDYESAMFIYIKDPKVFRVVVRQEADFQGACQTNSSQSWEDCREHKSAHIEPRGASEGKC